jgi:hypothetical protein
MWSSTNMLIKDVNDKFSDLTVSAFVTAGHAKIMLLHDQKTDGSAVRQFFADLHEMFVKVVVNPFYEKDAPIVSSAFDASVRARAKALFSR